MAENTGISWTDSTWNPWHGCKKVSEGCKFCYMYRDKERRKPNGEKFDVLTDRMKEFYDPTVVMRATDSSFYAPLRKKAFKEPQKVFTCSWSDFFIEEADEWRNDAWEVIRKTPHLTYQILTKRPERIKQCLPSDWGKGYKNVWLGVTIENQKAANERISLFLDVPALVHFVSVEPQIGEVDLTQCRSFVPGEYVYTVNALNGTESCWNPSGPVYDIYHDEQLKSKIDWVIVGGESGNDNGKYQYRPCNLDWVQKVLVDCQNYGTSVWVKQMGTHLAKEMRLKARHGDDVSEWPDYLRVQRFPVSV